MSYTKVLSNAKRHITMYSPSANTSVKNRMFVLLMSKMYIWVYITTKLIKYAVEVSKLYRTETIIMQKETRFIEVKIFFVLAIPTFIGTVLIL